MFYLRFGVYVLTISALVLVLAAGWFWRTLYWQQGYLVLQPLSPLSFGDQSAWSWPELSQMVLQQQLMQLFVAIGSELQIQIAAGEVGLQVLLPASALSVLEQLPVWPGWRLVLMEVLPQGGWWSLHLRWQKSESRTVVTGANIPSSEMNVDEALWQLAQVEQRLGAVYGAAVQTSRSTELDWQLAAIWSQGGYWGIWLRAKDGSIHRLEQGAMWHGFELIRVNVDGVTWRGPMGRVHRQALCAPLFICGSGL